MEDSGESSLSARQLHLIQAPDQRAVETDRLARAMVCQEEEEECEGKERRWRRADGKCNNLESPRRGSSHSAYRRLLAPAYSDSHEMREGSEDISPSPL